MSKIFSTKIVKDQQLMFLCKFDFEDDFLIEEILIVSFSMMIKSLLNLSSKEGFLLIRVI
jgi:hypothetical protein